MELLKWKHAEIALARNVDLIRWTYDPLQGVNANLNINKLGGIVREYKVNHYGVRAGGSPQNYGMPSDRFVVDWHLTYKEAHRPDVSRRSSYQDLMASGECSLVNVVATDERSLPFIQESFLNIKSPRLLVEIPADFGVIRRHPSKGNLDIEWRLKTRDIFMSYLNAGYTVVGFLSEQRAGRRRSLYLLEK
jgi:chorismate synthase